MNYSFSGTFGSLRDDSETAQIMGKIGGGGGDLNFARGEPIIGL